MIIVDFASRNRSRNFYNKLHVHNIKRLEENKKIYGKLRIDISSFIFYMLF